MSLKLKIFYSTRIETVYKKEIHSLILFYLPADLRETFDSIILPSSSSHICKSGMRASSLIPVIILTTIDTQLQLCIAEQAINYSCSGWGYHIYLYQPEKIHNVLY